MAISPPRPQSPSLNALRAFESAARLNGFSKAAEELCVSPGAIAQHIKTLEGWAGAALFDRHARGINLTALGQDVLDPLGHAFDQMGQAVQTLRTRADPHHIHIAALPAIAQLWLSHRLPDIRAAMPHVTLSISALENPPNLMRDPYDLSIFVIENTSEHIENDEVFPVCAPGVAAKISGVTDIFSWPCLADSTWNNDWETWLKFVAPGQKISARGPVFSLYALAVEDAINGAGLLMGRKSLVQHAIDQGKLVRPFAEAVSIDQSITITPRSGELSFEINALIDLLAAKGSL